MAKEVLTDEQVEEEIARLRNSEYVKLARREEAVRYRRRQILYSLRSYERRGIRLAESGVTLESLECDGDESAYAYEPC